MLSAVFILLTGQEFCKRAWKKMEIEQLALLLKATVSAMR